MTQHVSEAASKIIGSLSPAKKESSSTGMPHGETGSAVKLSTELPVVELAALSDSAANKALMESLAPFCRLRPRYSKNLAISTPENYETEGEVTAEARAVLEASMRPIDREAATKALMGMALLTKSRLEDGQTEELRVRLYLEKLQQYPADAVIRVCEEWTNSNTFWPAWSELRERLEARVSQRRKMLEAVK